MKRLLMLSVLSLAGACAQPDADPRLFDFAGLVPQPPEPAT